MILRLLRKLSTAESIGLILAFVALGTMTYGISSSLNGMDAGYLLRVCFISALLSLGLAKSKLNASSASVVMTALGFIGTWIVGAGLAHPLIGLMKSLMEISPQVFPNISYRFDVDASHLMTTSQTILVASIALSTRLKTWLVSINTNQAVNDPLIRNLIWVFAFWFLSAWMGWFTGKRSAVAALLPAIIVMAEIASYSRYRIDSLWLMVFILLLLMGVWNYRNTTVKWEQHKVDYSDSIRFDNGQAVLFLSVVIGLIAIITPSISWHDVRDYLQRHQPKQKGAAPAEILGIKEPPRQPNIGFTPTPSLPREHWLSGGFAQSEDIVMTIQTGELAPAGFSGIPVTAPRYYWRSTVYDTYVGAGWITTSAPAQNYKANTPLISGVLDGYRPLHLDVQIQQPEGRLFWSGVLYSADIPFRADWRLRPVSDPFADRTALLQADMFQVASTATSYTVQSYVPDIAVQDLRNAPSEYPAEIQERYLQLPQELPDRVRQRAMQITQGNTTPYDKAQAIESYLRKNFPYDLNIPAPPKDKDVADYFLFELKRGYCDYYATTMVVMARSVGIPARFVSGYASGDYDAENARYVVRELHAHSWPEIYFPNIGWIEFEPTASQPEIIRPEKNLNLATPQKQENSISHFLFRLANTTWTYGLASILLVLILLFLYYAVLERIIFMTLKPQAAIEKLFQRYYRLGRPLAGELQRAETAYEFTNKLIFKLEDVYIDSNSSLLINARTVLMQFTKIHQLSLFSNHNVNKDDIRLAFQYWKQLRRYLILSRIRNFFQRKNNWIKNKVTRLSFRST